MAKKTTIKMKKYLKNFFTRNPNGFTIAQYLACCFLGRNLSLYIVAGAKLNTQKRAMQLS